MIELEKKSWIHNPAKVLAILHKQAVYIRSFLKKDTYYTHYSNKGQLFQLIENPLLLKDLKVFRIRKVDSKKYILTYKKRQIRDSCELNTEYEISFNQSLKWKNFFKYLGYRIFVSKVKEVKLFQYQDFSIEYNHIKDLGYFLEVEILNPKKIEQSIQDLKAIFEIFGLADFEPKPYISLILEKKYKLKKEK